MAEKKIHFQRVAGRTACGMPDEGLRLSLVWDDITCVVCQRSLDENERAERSVAQIERHGFTLVRYTDKNKDAWEISPFISTVEGVLEEIDNSKLMLCPPCGDTTEFDKQDLLNMAQAILDAFGDKK